MKVKNPLRKEKIASLFYNFSELGTKASLKEKYLTDDLFSFVEITCRDRFELLKALSLEYTYYYQSKP